MFYFIRTFTGFFFSYACLNPHSALAQSVTIDNEDWYTLNSAFGSVGDDGTVSYVDPSTGTNFGDSTTNPTIDVIKTGVTLLGNGGNRTALDALLDKIPGWIANDDCLADFNAQLQAAVANITTGMTTYTGSTTARTSVLFLNTAEAGTCLPFSGAGHCPALPGVQGATPLR